MYRLYRCLNSKTPIWVTPNSALPCIDVLPGWPDCDWHLDLKCACPQIGHLNTSQNLFFGGNMVTVSWFWDTCMHVRSMEGCPLTHPILKILGWGWNAVSWRIPKSGALRNCFSQFLWVIQLLQYMHRFWMVLKDSLLDPGYFFKLSALFSSKGKMEIQHILR